MLKRKSRVFLLILMICACTGNLCENECVNLEKRAKLDSPKNFQAISGNASVLLTWDKVDNADYKYVLSYEKNEIEISPDVGYFTVENLENGETYEFALAAQKAGNLTSDLVKVTATPGENLNKIPQIPAFNIWFKVFDQGNYPVGDSDEGYKIYNEGGVITNGIVSETKEIINNTKEVSELIIKYSDATYAILRDGEDVRWFTMKKVGYHWEVWGYIYNVAFENSNAELDETITELELDTALDLQKYEKN